jgi:DNA polymerase-3 subunit gamma/tau
MSLYRKYRPQTFEDVVGQEHIAQTLRNALSAEPLRVAHAYLFCGPRGTGKTTSARLLAKCLNCEQGPTPTPCNQCDFCTRVRDNQAVMDLVEIDAASNTGVDNVREAIIEKVNVAPAQGRYRVYIIDEVHMLSTSSFNALLKTLEEPPAHAVFVLATTDAHKVPPTISSRCQRFDFRRVGPNDIIKRLQYVAKCENIDLEAGAARLVAHTADGALRDALTLLEQVTAFSAESIAEADVRLVLGTVSSELLQYIMDAVAQQDPAAALQQIERATEEGVSFSQLTRDLTNYCRDLMLLTVGFESTSSLSATEKQQRAEHARQIGRAHLRCVEALRAAEKEMRQSTDHRLLLELTLVRAASGELGTAEVEAPALPRPVARPVERPIAEKPLPRQESTPERPRPVWEETPATAEMKAPVARQQVAPLAAPHDEEPLPEPIVAAQATTIPVTTTIVVEDEAEAETLPAAEVPMMNDVPLVHEMPVVNDLAVSNEIMPQSGGTKKKGRRIHNLEEFKELWPFVLLRVKKKIGVTAVAYLHDAYPTDFTDKEAVLEFRKEFHFEKACEAAKRLPFEQVLNECLATPHLLRFRLAEAKPKAAPAPVADTALHDDEDEEDDADILGMAQSMFAAEVVGRSGGG